LWYHGRHHEGTLDLLPDDRAGTRHPDAADTPDVTHLLDEVDSGEDFVEDSGTGGVILIALDRGVHFDGMKEGDGVRAIVVIRREVCRL
jgi:hypothetical protein